MSSPGILFTILWFLLVIGPLPRCVGRHRRLRRIAGTRRSRSLSSSSASITPGKKHAVLTIGKCSQTMRNVEKPNAIAPASDASSVHSRLRQYKYVNESAIKIFSAASHVKLCPSVSGNAMRRRIDSAELCPFASSG